MDQIKWAWAIHQLFNIYLPLTIAMMWWVFLWGREDGKDGGHRKRIRKTKERIRHAVTVATGTALHNSAHHDS